MHTAHDLDDNELTPQYQKFFRSFNRVSLLAFGAAALTACIVTSPPAPTPACPAAEKCPSGTQCLAPPAPASSAPVAQAREAAKSEPPRTYELKGTVVREMHSDVTGKDYELLIGLPPSFEKEPNRRYPVLYALDGQWDYKLLDSVIGGLRYDEVMPDIVVVGISYGGKDPNYDSLRADDYVPTRAKDKMGNEKGGGAAKFLSWLETTAIPLVEREYRGDPAHRILSGSSFGGLFTLYTLFEKPELFESYVAISPAVGWDSRYLFAREKDFRKQHPKLDRRIWLSSGSDEWTDYLKAELDFFAQFKSSKYDGVSLKVQQIAGERHTGVKPEAYNRAMRFVAEPWLPKPPAKKH